MSIKFIENNQLFSTSLSSKFIFDNQTEISSRWKFIFNNKINFNSEKKSICIRGYKPEELIQLWNQIHQTNLILLFN
jgi:hypothetical protein